MAVWAYEGHGGVLSFVVGWSWVRCVGGMIPRGGGGRMGRWSCVFGLLGWFMQGVQVFSRYRVRVAGVLGGVLVLGVLSRGVPIGCVVWDKYLGDSLYAVAFYLGVSLLWGSPCLFWKVLITSVYVSVIEVFQRSGVPLRLGASPSRFVRLFAYLVLGSHFSWWDMAAYAVGVGVIVVVDRWLAKGV